MKSIPVVNNNDFLSLIYLNLYSMFRPLQFMEQNTKKYGDRYQFKLKNNSRYFVFSDPEIIEAIFTAAGKFNSGQANQGLKFMFGDRSLILMDGKAHRNRRRLLMPAFHGESLQSCSRQIIEITDEVCDLISIGQPFRVRTYMQEITLRVILNLVFGVSSGAKCDRVASRRHRLRTLLTEMLDTFNSPTKSLPIFFPWMQKDWGKYSPWGRFVHLKAEIKSLILQEIAARRKLLEQGKVTPNDIFNLLLLSKDEAGKGMSDEELHDELITLLFAGHETTASALTWLIYWIHFKPEVETTLRAELQSLKEPLDYQAINNLPYLNAVIAETLRIYPISDSTFVRIPAESLSLLGYDFEPQDVLNISIYDLHQREDLYPAAKSFQPERFLDKNYSPSEYIPFGGGSRRCIGSALALLEMKLVIVRLLSRFQFELVSKRPLSPVRRGITMAPPNSFKAIATSLIL